MGSFLRSIRYLSIRYFGDFPLLNPPSAPSPAINFPKFPALCWLPTIL
jgi:hypothetical protein